MIDHPPKDWKELQKLVHKIYTEIGCKAEIDKRVETARSPADIDVYVEDTTTSPTLTYLCECKYWNRPVPKSFIHTFRSIVADKGANAGYIISKLGFQKGS